MRHSKTKTSLRHWPKVLTGSVLVMSLMTVGAVVAKDNNLHFDGTLVADPCMLDPKTTDIQLDFGEVVDRYLYLNTRTHSQPFTINLIECDTRLGNSVLMTFKGTESSELPGLLALSTGPASGIAIGMELDDGTPLPFNKATPKFALQDNSTALRFRGYVQGEPTAIKNHGIGRGNFTAVATFEIEYP
ncbi:fimbrial protein [Cedecea neteri]|uniref:fimbrial protein n=1 Tax=Cedecea neteri TaxID=158822 RepID=UPI002AA6B627|nr:fimbrial protein [Cedecea neteri]WPU21980.1 fimbrial protein [Cedecea neteri]